MGIYPDHIMNVAFMLKNANICKNFVDYFKQIEAVETIIEDDHQYATALTTIQMLDQAELKAFYLLLLQHQRLGLFTHETGTAEKKAEIVLAIKKQIYDCQKSPFYRYMEEYYNFLIHHSSNTSLEVRFSPHTQMQESTAYFAELNAHRTHYPDINGEETILLHISYYLKLGNVLVIEQVIHFLKILSQELNTSLNQGKTHPDFHAIHRKLIVAKKLCPTIIVPNFTKVSKSIREYLADPIQKNNLLNSIELNINHLFSTIKPIHEEITKISIYHRYHSTKIKLQELMQEKITTSIFTDKYQKINDATKIIIEFCDDNAINLELALEKKAIQLKQYTKNMEKIIDKLATAERNIIYQSKKFTEIFSLLSLFRQSVSNLADNQNSISNSKIDALKMKNNKKLLAYEERFTTTESLSALNHLIINIENDLYKMAIKRENILGAEGMTSMHNMENHQALLTDEIIEWQTSSQKWLAIFQCQIDLRATNRDTITYLADLLENWDNFLRISLILLADKKYCLQTQAMTILNHAHHFFVPYLTNINAIKINANGINKTLQLPTLSHDILAILPSCFYHQIQDTPYQGHGPILAVTVLNPPDPDNYIDLTTNIAYELKNRDDRVQEIYQDHFITHLRKKMEQELTKERDRIQYKYGKDTRIKLIDDVILKINKRIEKYAINIYRSYTVNTNTQISDARVACQRIIYSEIESHLLKNHALNKHHYWATKFGKYIINIALAAPLLIPAGIKYFFTGSLFMNYQCTAQTNVEKLAHEIAMTR